MKKKLTFLFIASGIICLSTSCGGNKSKPFLEEIGVCTGIDNADMLSGKGFNYIEGSVGAIMAPSLSDDEYAPVLQKIREAALPVKSCNSFLPGNLKCVGPEPAHEELLSYMETAFRRAQQVGVEYIVFGSGRSRAIPDSFPADVAREQFIALCKKMAPLAAKYGVVVVLEPLNKGEVNFINSVEEGGAIVREVDHPNFRLLADIYHMMKENESPESIIKNGDLIRHIHIAELEGRAAPGTHNEDFTPYLKALKEIGYEGRMSIECRWEDLENQSGTALETLRQQIATITNK